MKTINHKLSLFLALLFTCTTWSCEKDAVNVFSTTYWVSESIWDDNGETKSFYITLWFEDETRFMLFNGNNPLVASVPSLKGTYHIEGKTLTLTPEPVYSSVVPGGCVFTIQSNTLTNQQIVIDGKTHFNGVWEKGGTYSIETK